MSADAGRRASSAGAVALAAALDVAAVVAFAALGRSQHGRAETLEGLWHTAWPFLAALAIAWACALVWRAPTAVVRSGVPVWVVTLALGLLLRVLFTDGGAALPFVLVATGSLGLTLVGWRACATLLLRRRPAPRPRAER